MIPETGASGTSACIRFTDPDGEPRTVLIDAGPDLRQQVLAHQIDRLDAILFTHNHVDHTFGLDEVRRFNVVMRSPIDVYAEDRTLDHLRRVYQHIFEPERNVQASFVASLIAHRLEAERAIVLHGVRFTPIRLLHGRLPILGFRIEPDRPGDWDGSDPWWPLAYCTDVSGSRPRAGPG